MTAEEGSPSSKGKAGRNEARKLMGTFFNNLGVAFFVAALIQPVLLLVQEGGSVSRLGWGASLALAVVGAISVLTAQGIARRVED